ncbi:unnamed protein product [Penicillium roqueforti FM164]|uniref:Uncharacterized protein n=1 Tax=Penicillium roqueforti (strain FM164) TaxID=1365484 RepID=W6QPP3_PENRF|nr:unnamed protein product [Penicillium roqueforti FM164]
MRGTVNPSSSASKRPLQSSTSELSTYVKKKKNETFIQSLTAVFKLWSVLRRMILFTMISV